MNQFLEKIRQKFAHQDSDLSSPLGLTTLSAEEKRILSRFLQLREFAADEIVYRAKTPSTAVYYINRGSVGLFYPVESDREERVQYLSAGRWFGFSSITADEPRAFSARALEPCEFSIILKHDLEMLNTLAPALTNKILLGLSRDIYFSLLEQNKEYARLLGRLTKSNIVV